MIWLNSVVAGLVATFIVSIVMVIKGLTATRPAFDITDLLATVLSDSLGLHYTPGLGWVAFFVLGTLVGGGLFAALADMLPGNRLVQGLFVGVIVWIGLMLVIMPLAGRGFFGVDIGPVAAWATLLGSLLYGGMLGLVFANLTPPRAQIAIRTGHTGGR
ncbi:MAG: DUF6789 family protein [Hyphomicrobiaceae bacterium]